MHVYSPIVYGHLKEKKRPKTLIVWVLGRVEKKIPKKSQKLKKYFFVLNKFQSVTHVSTCNFQGLFKNIVFRSVALVTKKFWANFRFFFHRPNFFPPSTLPYKLKKIFFIKKSINYYSLNFTGKV